MYYLVEAYNIDVRGKRRIAETYAALANQVGGMVLRMLESGATLVEVSKMSEETFQLFSVKSKGGPKAKDEQT